MNKHTTADERSCTSAFDGARMLEMITDDGREDHLKTFITNEAPIVEAFGDRRDWSLFAV